MSTDCSLEEWARKRAEYLKNRTVREKFVSWLQDYIGCWIVLFEDLVRIVSLGFINLQLLRKWDSWTVNWR